MLSGSGWALTRLCSPPRAAQVHPRYSPSMEPLTAILLLVAGFLAGIVNALAGGGSFITLTALVVAGGLTVDVANGTNRVAIALQSLASFVTFHRAGHTELGLVARLAPATIAGAVVGASLSLEVPRDVFENIVGVAMLGMMALVLLRPKRFLDGAVRASRLSPGPIDLVFFGIGLYGGFLQAGVGVFLLFGLVGFAGRDLVAANVAKVVLALVFTVPALLVFASQGAVDWWHGLVLAVGTSVGGVVGAKVALKGGAPAVRWVLLAVLAASAGRFLLG